MFRLFSLSSPSRFPLSRQATRRSLNSSANEYRFFPKHPLALGVRVQRLSVVSGHRIPLCGPANGTGFCRNLDLSRRRNRPAGHPRSRSCALEEGKEGRVEVTAMDFPGCRQDAFGQLAIDGC